MNADTPDSEPKPQLVIFGRAVRELREQREMSAGLLSARTGSTLQRVHELEAGGVDPDYEELIALAEKGFGIRLSTLVAYAARYESRPRSP